MIERMKKKILSQLALMENRLYCGHNIETACAECLKKISNYQGLRGNCSGLRGNCIGLSGDCSGLSGDCSGLSGNCTGLRGNCSEIKELLLTTKKEAGK